MAALQETIIFDGLEVHLYLFLFCAAWLLSPKLGLLMLAVGIMHISWSLFLNQRMFRDSLPIDKNGDILLAIEQNAGKELKELKRTAR